MSLFDNGQKIGCAFCTPCPNVRLPDGKLVLDSISMTWHRQRTALALPTNFNTIEFFADGMEVGEARSQVAYRCLEHEPRPEFLFFLDYDVLPQHDALLKLHYRARTWPEHDIFAGVYCCKGRQPADPLIYAGDGHGPFWDWAVGDLLTTEQHGISSVHMGLTLIRVSLFQRILEARGVADGEPFFVTSNDTSRVNGVIKTRKGTEDIWFCDLARRAVGAKILVDTSVLAGHVDKRTGITWGLPEDSPPVQRAQWLKNGKNGAAQEKIALDLGAGGIRREWPGYKTFTTDLRADTKPDYCQDTRFLNLPDGHFDLTASSHHLEHLPRWDQERVWQEIFRVTKPGGETEHYVPSLEWAAAKIADNQPDEHVYNVLYGAQEAHGYERHLNLHYFGYTKDVARALAEQAGFVDVTLEDWRDKPDLVYNLIVRGRKPSPAPETSPVS